MKSLLTVLFCLLVLQTKVFAIHGGYSLGNSTSLIGTYAGAFVPSSVTSFSGTTGTTIGSNALGLFTLSIPQTGLGSGTVVIFSNGHTFTGSIQALSDTQKPGFIRGVVNATFNYNLSIQTSATSVVTEAITANAQGNLVAQTAPDVNSVSPLGIDLIGSADVSIDQGFVGADGNPIVTEEIVFSIDGFKQTNIASTSGT